MPTPQGPHRVQELRLRQEFRRLYGGSGERIFRAPGRVNLIGAHVDYSGGPVLPIAVDRSVLVAMRRSPDASCRLASLDLPDHHAWPVDQSPTAAGAGWAAYPLGVWQTLREDGVDPGAFELLVASNLPVGAGLSSSAALLVASSLGFSTLLGLEETAEDRARRAHRAETGFVGVPCGIMDQYASSLARSGHALWLDCRRADYRHVPLDAADVQFAVVDSGTSHDLREGGYHQRVAESGAAWQHLQQALPGHSCLAEVTAAELDQHGGGLSEVPLRRARHVIREVERVQEAVAALEAGDWERVGELVSASHASSRDDYQTSTERLDCLQEAALTQTGVLGARVTGAGFGGGLLVLLRRQTAAQALTAVQAAFEQRFGEIPPYWMLDTGEAPGELGPTPDRESP